MRTLLFAAALGSLAACGGPQETAPEPAAAPVAVDGTDWRLDGSVSRIAFVSTKAGEVAETHYFRDLSGQVSPDGTAELEIDLDSVETDIDIRNERMREMFFETEAHPSAMVTAELSPEAFTDLAVGDRMRHAATVTISLHGLSMDFDSDLFVTRIDEDRMLVETATPILLHAADFDLLDGVSELAEIANLPSISPAVPTTVSLVFERGEAAG